MNLNWCMNRFRLASRDLFNQYFAVPHAPAEYDYEFYEGFEAVERTLFESLVLEPCAISSPEGYRYGSSDYQAHPLVRVRLPNPNTEEDLVGDPLVAPILINRELASGYWDFPLNLFTNEVELHFIAYFDWERMHYRDNQYVRVKINNWPSHPDVVGKHALVEARLIRCVLSDLIS